MVSREPDQHEDLLIEDGPGARAGVAFLFQGCSLAASSFFFGPPAFGSRRSAWLQSHSWPQRFLAVLRAPRLMAIKQAVMREIASQDLSVAAIARRQGVSPRYIHRLLESEGTTLINSSGSAPGPRVPVPDEPAPCPSQDRGHRLCRWLRRRVPFQPHVPLPLCPVPVRGARRGARGPQAAAQ
jgi:AraC-like DNA-binding protein